MVNYAVLKSFRIRLEVVRKLNSDFVKIFLIFLKNLLKNDHLIFFVYFFLIIIG